MAERTVDLGIVTAYAEAVSKGYEGTEAEFGEGLARSADYANNAQASATQAQGYASNASASAQASATSASNAEGFKNQASGFANNASASATVAEGYKNQAQEYAESAEPLTFTDADGDGNIVIEKTYGGE